MTAQPGFADRAVAEVFDAYPPALRAHLMTLRALILETAAALEPERRLIETLKWGQPAYLWATGRTGSTIRLDALRDEPDRYAFFVHCRTTLMQSFKTHYPDLFDYRGERALVLRQDEPLDEAALRHCIALALTYGGAKPAVAVRGRPLGLKPGCRSRSGPGGQPRSSR